MQILKGLAAQLLGASVAMTVWQLHPAPLPGIIALQAVVAAVASRLLGQPGWWIPIHLAFIPAAAAMMWLQVPAWIYLLLVLLMALIFWGTVKGDVPLFLSSEAVADALETIVTQEKANTFIDLGAGTGSVVVPLAERKPRMTIEAWEHAPVPWAICAWRCQELSNALVYRLSFWECDLSIFDVVFAFLSPAVMPRLGIKALREMRPGALLVSSSFPIPDWEPESVVELEDRMKTRLYCYRIKP